MKKRLIQASYYIIIAGILSALFFSLTSSKPPETVAPKARIVFYPPNNNSTNSNKSWISRDAPEVVDGTVCFTTQQGNRVCVSGNFTVEHL